TTAICDSRPGRSRDLHLDRAAGRERTDARRDATVPHTTRVAAARRSAGDGHDVVTAKDGAAAFDLLTRTQGAFELLLSDIRMPVMDGIALALATARDHPRIGILLMTGYADQRERACGLEALIHNVIAKPFS